MSANKQPIVVTNSSAPQVNQAILLVLYMVSPVRDCNQHMVAMVYNQSCVRLSLALTIIKIVRKKTIYLFSCVDVDICLEKVVLKYTTSLEY